MAGTVPRARVERGAHLRPAGVVLHRGRVGLRIAVDRPVGGDHRHAIAGVAPEPLDGRVDPAARVPLGRHRRGDELRLAGELLLDAVQVERARDDEQIDPEQRRGRQHQRRVGRGEPPGQPGKAPSE